MVIYFLKQGNFESEVKWRWMGVISNNAEEARTNQVYPASPSILPTLLYGHFSWAILANPLTSDHIL